MAPAMGCTWESIMPVAAAAAAAAAAAKAAAAAAAAVAAVAAVAAATSVIGGEGTTIMTTDLYHGTNSGERERRIFGLHW